MVFPADAGEIGAKGLCYPWNDETKKFSEYPVEIPRYQKTYYENTFLTTETKEDTVINTICRINEGSRQAVELRKWALPAFKDPGTHVRRCHNNDSFDDHKMIWSLELFQELS